MRRVLLAATVLCWSAVLLLGCGPAAVADVGAPASNPVPTAAASGTVIAMDENYKLVEEDILRLDVWGEPQLSNMQMQVTPDGKINVPFIGSMKAAGLTHSELTASIVEALEKGEIIADARVQITLVTMHQPTARVLGEVNRAGTVVFKDGDTILDAIASAGSYTDNAMLSKASITHRGSDKQTPIDLKKMLYDGDMSQNLKLQQGDTIYVPPEDYNNKAYVLGQVNRPGIIPLKDRTSILTAISIAGGHTEKGSLRHTVVVRGDPAKPERVVKNLYALFDKGDVSQDIALLPGDVVIVPERKGLTWEKIQQVMGAVVNLGYITRLGLF